jgi:filamentous hemagglutinin family protein
MKEIDAQPRSASRLFRNMPTASGSALILFSIGLAQAAPEAGSVAAGSATIMRSAPQRTDIVQQSHRAVIDWRSFSVNANEHVNFRQPSADSSTLNRVTGPDISQIHGRVTANGQLFLVNPHGIVFGKDAKIDVAGLVASTANIANADFMAGNYRFSDALDRSARIVNRGEINVAEGGFAALVAPGVENSGVIRARLGRIALASGNAFTLDLYGDQLISLVADSAIIEQLTDAQGRPLTSLLVQSGEISADGGKVLLTASAAKGVIDNVINMNGVVRARSAEMRNGEIVLHGGDAGAVQVSGVLDAGGRGSGEVGGSVSVLGDKVSLVPGARVDVSGDVGGGTVLVGGDFKGQGPAMNASQTIIARGAAIEADALSRGNGGKVIVWAEGLTNYQGVISAQGGAVSGNGGFVEVSGKERLSFDGEVALSAAAGMPGSLLLDPPNLVVGQDIQASAIADILQQGANATFQADQDIIVEQRIDGRSTIAGGALTLVAGRNVNVNNDILTSGPVDIRANAGDLLMGSGPSDSITNGSGTVIATGSGPISLTASGQIDVQHLLSSGRVSINSSSGSVNLMQGLGGRTSEPFASGGFTVTAQNTVDVNGKIISDGPVTIAASEVVLRHSIFTNNQPINIGRAGGKVTLDPADDEVLTATAFDALSKEKIEAATIQDNNTPEDLDDDTFDETTGGVLASGQTAGERTLDESRSRGRVQLTTKQITLDTGASGADIIFHGVVDIPNLPVPGSDTTLHDFTFIADFPSRADAAGGADFHPQGYYIALNLGAGRGAVFFAEGIAPRAATQGTAVSRFNASNPNADFPRMEDQRSTNTIDLIVRSASQVTAGVPSSSFVHSPQDFSVPTMDITRIFHRMANVENTVGGPDNNGEQPPMFPEPQLGGPGSATALGFVLPRFEGTVRGIVAQVEQPERDVAQSEAEELRGECKGFGARDCPIVTAAPGSGEGYEDNEYLDGTTRDR